jgi:hypothetical protein
MSEGVVIEYQNLDLTIRGDEAAGYTVEVVGPREERAAKPFGWESISALGASLAAIREGAEDRSILQEVGHALFQALFPMEILMVYGAAKGRLADNEGLRLRLHLPPELAHLPWELLYYPRYYLATDLRSPVVRFLDLPDAPRPLRVRPPLRLLHLIANPVDARELNADREAGLLDKALQDLVSQGSVEILPGQPGTQKVLLDGLRQGCHLLHFTGHGIMDGERGYLLFEDEQGRGEPVDSDTLAHLLRGTDVRLAMLNACESASAADGDAFGSVAAALIYAGLPAVVAHQLAMPDRSAIPFAGEFYKALAEGFPVDAAVTQGRKAILSTLGTSWWDHADWAIPTLMMRAPDGHILALEVPEEQTESRAPQATTTVQQQVHAERDATTVGHIEGEVVNISFGAGPTAASEPAPEPGSRSVPLPDLLAGLRRTVRQYAPPPKRAQAVEQVATLSGAAQASPPDLAALASVLTWFRAEVPQLSGAVLGTIRGVQPMAEAAGDDVLWEFEERFGPFSD